jgi:predicted TIM-barrel fold metal-dependent hydrolase
MVDLVEFLTHAPRPVGALQPRVDPPTRQRHFTIISVDDHFIEPPDLFEGRLAARFVDAAPRVVRRDDADWWVFADRQVPLLGADAVQTWEPGEGYSGPVTFDELRPGTWRPADRVRDMDINGVAASLNFPSTTWGFAGRVFMYPSDPPLGLALVRAYNDWIYERWMSPYPDRFIGCQVTWLLDPQLAATEIERNADRGFKAVSFSENPAKLGLPSIHQSSWDPFLRACEETGTVINLHVGSSSETLVPGPDSAAVIGILFPINAFVTCADWLYAAVPTRFPRLKIAFSEGGIGWVPMLLDRIEYGRRHGNSDERVFGDLSPAEVLHRNFWFTTFSDPRTIALRHDVGVDRIMVETDYPHSDSSWPDTQQLLASQLADVSNEEAELVTWRNAAALYGHVIHGHVGSSA